jgi:hypothetical protein
MKNNKENAKQKKRRILTREIAHEVKEQDN